MEYTRNPTPDIRRFYNTILSLRRFNALFHHPLVLQVVESLLAQPIFVHLRVICHLIFPGRPNHTADPHQDFAPVRGSQHTRTAWIPLGHCGDHLGGVAVASRVSLPRLAGPPFASPAANCTISKRFGVGAPSTVVTY